MLDADLARIYGVLTKALNRAIKRNADRFPEDFVFKLTGAEAMRCQIGTASRRNVRHRPYAFTEFGAIQAANVLSSPQAAKMGIYVVRAFVRMRTALGSSRELAGQLAALEQELKARLDVHEAAIVDILQRVIDLFDPPALPEPQHRELGFHAPPAEQSAE